MLEKHIKKYKDDEFGWVVDEKGEGGKNNLNHTSSSKIGFSEEAQRIKSIFPKAFKDSEKRLTKLLNFLTKAEEKIFDEKRVEEVSVQELKELYKIASGQVLSYMELLRKYLVQEGLTGSVPEIGEFDEMKALMLNLRPSTLQKVMDMIRTETVKEE